MDFLPDVFAGLDGHDDELRVLSRPQHAAEVIAALGLKDDVEVVHVGAPRARTGTILLGLRMSGQSLNAVLADPQDGRPFDPVSREISKRTVRLLERVRRCGDPHADSQGDGEELLAVAPSVCRDTDELPLFEQMPLVVQGRYVSQMYPCDGEAPTWGERLQCRRHQVTDRREEDCRI